MKKILIIFVLLFILSPCYADDYYEKRQEQKRYEQKLEEQRFQDKRQEERAIQDRIYQRKLDNYYIDKKNNLCPIPTSMPMKTPYYYW